MKRHVMAIAFVFSVMCLSSNNCIAVSDGQTLPELTFNFVKLVGFQYPWLSLKVDFSILNSNEFDVNVSAIDYELVVQNHSVHVDGLKEKVKFESKKKTRIRFPLKININKILPVFPEVLSVGKVPYRIRGLITVDEFFIPLPFDYSGVLTLQDI